MRHCKTNCAFVRLGFRKCNIQRVSFAAPTSGLVFTVVVVLLYTKHYAMRILNSILSDENMYSFLIVLGAVPTPCFILNVDAWIFFSLLIPHPLNMLMLLSVECVNMLRVGYNSILFEGDTTLHS